MLLGTSLNFHMDQSLGTVKGKEETIRWAPELLNSNGTFSFFALPASDNTGYFFFLAQKAPVIKKQTACRYSAITIALIIVHTSLSWYCSIHTGFVIITFLADWMCCIDMYLCNCIVCPIANSHFGYCYFIYFFKRGECKFVSLFLTRDIFFFHLEKKKKKNLTIVQSGTSIVLYKIICTFLSRGILIIRPKGNFIAKYINQSELLYKHGNQLCRTFAIWPRIGIWAFIQFIFLFGKCTV